MKAPTFWNFAPSSDGETLEIAITGVIDAGWFAESADTSSAEIAAQLQAHKGAKRVNVTINSLGGSLVGGVAIFNLLRAHGAEVTTTIIGVGASAAAIVFLAGDKRRMGAGALMMVHDPSTATVGTAAEHRKQADTLDVARDALASIIANRTGKALEEVKALLAAETWLTAQQAVEQGFAHEVAGVPLQVEAHADGVMVAGTLFARVDLPAPILALVPAPAPPAPPPPAPSTPAAFSAIDLFNAQRDGKLIGADEERQRIRAILELGIHGHADLINRALFEAPAMTAAQVLMEAHRADRASRGNVLEARLRESAVVANVRQSAPERTTEQKEMEAAKNIAEHANRRR